MVVNTDRFSSFAFGSTDRAYRGNRSRAVHLYAFLGVHSSVFAMRLCALAQMVLKISSMKGMPAREHLSKIRL